MKLFIKTNAFLLVLIILATIIIMPMSIHAEEEGNTSDDVRGSVVQCDCGGTQRRIGIVEISRVSFERHYCDSCHKDFYYLKPSCKCGGTVRYTGDVAAGGVQYAEHYCATCDNYFYCNLP